MAFLVTSAVIVRGSNAGDDLVLADVDPSAALHHQFHDCGLLLLGGTGRAGGVNRSTTL